MTPNPWMAVDVDTVPAKRARELRDAWEGFLDGDPSQSMAGSGTPPVRRPIVDSWRRCLEAGVDPSGRQPAPSMFDASRVRSLWREHPLSEASTMIGHCLSETADEADHLMVVSDADGTLLSIHGSPKLCSRAADSMNFAEGALWSEPGAGTNAIGTALAAERAVQVFAAEHFTEPVQRWTCSAAPVRDPDDGRLIGVIDLTGDFTTVHPHSMAVVIATAQAIEVFLQLKMREHDDRLWRRYEHRLDPGAVQRALVTASGRLIVGSPEHWGADTRLEVPDGGGEIVLPSGDLAVAEPVGDEAYVVTRVEPMRRRAPGAPPVLELWLLGPGPPHAALDGAPVALRPRLAELLAVLAAHPHGASADVLCAELYGDAGHPGSVRVEMSRLRKLLGAGLDTDRYRLAGELHSDVERVRGLLAANAVREAAEAYPGPLLPDSEAPRVVAERDELEGWLRTAVLGSDDAEALWAWVQGPSGADDLLAWSRLLGALAFTDARRSRAAARTRALREEL